MALACMVTHAENLNTTIQFVRNSDQATVCSCEQIGDLCSCDNTGYTDYQYVCAVGTNITNSENKVYVIVKRKTDDLDEGAWRCGSDSLGWSNPTFPIRCKYE